MTSSDQSRSDESGRLLADPMPSADPSTGQPLPYPGHQVSHPADPVPHAGHPVPHAGYQYPEGYPYPEAGYPYPYPPEPDRITRFVNRLQARLPRWAAPLAALGCIAGAVGYTLWADPARSAPDAIPSCFLKFTTGLDCPGCGGTRAAWYLLHGDLPAAARHHLLFVFVVPILLYLYVAWAGRLVFGWRLPQLQITPKAISIFLAVWMVFSVVRNLPWAPFDMLYV